jgi:hypothetical protein
MTRDKFVFGDNVLSLVAPRLRYGKTRLVNYHAGVQSGLQLERLCIALGIYGR